jgi:hypothetical protein
MPLLLYFSTIGAVLIALLLLINLLLEPRQPKSTKPASAAVETNLPKPRIASQVARQTVGAAHTASAAGARHQTTSPAAPAADARDRRIEPTAWNPVQTAQQSSIEGMQSKPLNSARSRGKSVRGRNTDAAWHHRAKKPAYSGPAYSSPGYRSYARERPTTSSWAEGTLGPH